MQNNNLICVLLFLLLVRCGSKPDLFLNVRLQQWDAMLEANPEAVRDSLQTLNPAILSNENNAYCGLLKIISDDKTYTEFTSDSLIRETENYYRNHAKSSNLHIRSLVYMGMVRIRMGMIDSTALIPLKEAEIIFNNLDNQNPSVGYLLNFFLGKVHHENKNFSFASKYFKKALQFSKEEKNFAHSFDSYMAMFWNSMEQEKFNEGKKYLDSLGMINSKSIDEQYFLLNAQSVYYDTQNMHEKSLEKEKEQIKLAPHIKEKPEVFRLYYSISDQYKDMNQLDSAAVYALKAIEHISDTTYQLNYLLYENVADIAEISGDYHTANNYRKQAALIREKTIEKETDKHILKLEKQYDLSRAENKALQAEAKTRIAIIIILCLVILIVVSLFYVRARRIKMQQEKRSLKEEKRKTEMDKELVEARAGILRIEVEKQQLTMIVYNMMLGQFFSLEKQLQSLADKARKAKPDFANFVDDVRASMNKNLVNDFAKTISDSKFCELTGISLDNKVNKSEFLMLYLIYCGVSNKNLATVFRTTPESIRSRKNQLKNKLLSLNISTSLFEQKGFSNT